MSVAPGQTLSHYRLIEKIGEGGMGVVWKALDTTLDREVAIKVLPEDFAGDRERLARFEREAKLLAAMNHPGIAAVYGLEESNGTRFLVMELVPGEDLRQRVVEGPIPLAEALTLCRQIAEALEAAHEKGVIHRDLKPGNIRITPEGKIKVLDFGLAKAFIDESISGDPSQSPTITSTGTRDGLILGTASYMSPEQAKGKAVDRRTDIWAFGVMLYEMLTGRRLFDGETISETLAAVIMKELEWEGLPASTPPRIQRLLRRCLQREPRSRLRDIGDARLTIEEILAGADRGGTEVEETVESRAIPSSVRSALIVLALLAGVAIGLVIAWSIRSAPPEALLRKFALPVESLGANLRISPDGKRVVYTADDRLWIRDLDRLEARELAGTAGALNAFWSPDGNWVAYGADGKLWKAPMDGGQPSVICELPGNRFSSGAGGAWCPDGTIIFTTGHTGLLRVAAQGGDATSLLEPDPDVELDFHDVSALPECRGVLFVVHRKAEKSSVGFSTIGLYSRGDRATLLTVEAQDVWDPVYSPTGHILFHRSPDNPGIWAVPFSLGSLEVTGQPFLVAADATAQSVSSDGTLAYIIGKPSRPSYLVRVDRKGEVVEKIGDQEAFLPFPALSPDDGRVAVPVEEHGQDIWVYDVDRGARSRLTFEGDCEEASWSPDGKQILYYAGPNITALRMKLRAADGTGEPQDLGLGYWPSLSPDGQHLVYAAFGEQGNIDLFTIALEGDGDPVLFLATDAQEKWPRVSPDGRYVAYVSSVSGRNEIYISRFPEGEGKWQVSVDGGNWPAWSGTGDRLFFTKGNAIFEVTIATEPSLSLDTPRMLFDRRPPGIPAPFGWPPGFDVSADGEYFFYVQSASEASDERAYAIVLNWFEEFER